MSIAFHILILLAGTYDFQSAWAQGRRHFIFDVDKTIADEIPASDIGKYPAERIVELTGRRAPSFYLVSPGVGALIQALLSEGDVSFYSGGPGSRNRQLLEKIKLPDNRTAFSVAKHVRSNADTYRREPYQISPEGDFSTWPDGKDLRVVSDEYEREVTQRLKQIKTEITPELDASVRSQLVREIYEGKFIISVDLSNTIMIDDSADPIRADQKRSLLFQPHTDRNGVTEDAMEAMIARGEEMSALAAIDKQIRIHNRILRVAGIIKAGIQEANIKGLTLPDAVKDVVARPPDSGQPTQDDRTFEKAGAYFLGDKVASPVNLPQHLAHVYSKIPICQRENYGFHVGAIP